MNSDKSFEYSSEPIQLFDQNLDHVATPIDVHVAILSEAWAQTDPYKMDAESITRSSFIRNTQI